LLIEIQFAVDAGKSESMFISLEIFGGSIGIETGRFCCVDAFPFC
jgi:hypothetical protein